MQPTEYSFNFLAEIQDEIIDHLSDQPHALRNCALTCQRWTRRAQMHIFREIPVLDHGRLVRIEHLLEASPYIARFVRVLTLSKHYTSLPQFDYAWAKLFTHMDRLEELNIGKLSRMSLPDFRDGLTTYLSRLRILRFTSVYDIDCDMRYPIRCGGYADIFRATYGHTQVAIKRLRSIRTEDHVKTRLVSLLSGMIYLRNSGSDGP